MLLSEFTAKNVQWQINFHALKRNKYTINFGFIRRDYAEFRILFIFLYFKTDLRYLEII